MKQTSFEKVLKLFHTLGDIEPQIIETLFYYKLTDMEDYDKESTQLAKDFKYNTKPGSKNNYKTKKSMGGGKKKD